MLVWQLTNPWNSELHLLPMTEHSTRQTGRHAPNYTLKPRSLASALNLNVVDCYGRVGMDFRHHLSRHAPRVRKPLL